MRAPRLYLRYAAVSVRAQLQYPGSFLTMAAGQFLATIVEIAGIWALFSRFGQIRGWRFGEIAVFYGVVNIAFSVADALTRGFDVFGPQFVQTGDFDRLLLRPRATALQLLGYELRLSRVGRLVQALLVFTIGAQLVDLQWNPRTVILLSSAVVGGMALFSGIMVLQATLAFWTVQSLEVANVLSYGGVEAAQYPLNVYAPWLRTFLIYIVPIGCVAYFPVVGVLGRHDPLGAPDWFLGISPLVGFFFLALALRIWGIGVRRYASTGS